MAEPRNVPNNIEQVAINNMVNIEALLEALINKGVLSESDFHASKNRIEQRILEAQKQARLETKAGE